MNEYFLKPKSLGANVKVEQDLSNCAKKMADLENGKILMHRIQQKKTYLASLKSDVHELDTNKLKNVPSNLNNLKNKVDKIDADKLVTLLLI